MKNRTKNAKIGIFVVFAVLLCFAAVVVLGSGKLFSPTFKYVAFFEGRLKGLKEGSRVMFRGVTIGSVKEITISVHDPVDSMNIPVIFEIELDKISSTASEYKNVVQARGAIENLIKDHGLRARLSIDSIVTGQLVIELDFMDDAELRFVGRGNLGYPEFPTVQSTVDQLTETLKEIPIHEMASHLNSVITGLDKRVNDPNLAKAIESLDELTEQYTAIGHRVNENILPKLEITLTNVSELSTALKSESLAKLNHNLDNADAVMDNINKALPELIAELNQLRSSFSLLSSAAVAAFGNIENVSDSNSEVLTELRTMMQEFAAAARSVGQMADFLQRHPEALLQGKAKSEGY